MLEDAERTTCCVTSMMDPKFKELVVSRPFFLFFGLEHQERIYSGNLTAESAVSVSSETSCWTLEIQLTKHFTLEKTPGRFLKIG